MIYTNLVSQYMKVLLNFAQTFYLEAEMLMEEIRPMICLPGISVLKCRTFIRSFDEITGSGVLLVVISSLDIFQKKGG